MEKKLAVCGIIIEEKDSVSQINEILHAFAPVIIGRMGLPNPERGVSVISLILDATNDEIGALTGKLGRIKGVSVKTAVAKSQAVKEKD